MAVDYFLYVDGLQGESEDSVHAGAIQMYGWSFGMSNSGASAIGGGGGTGRADIHDFHFEMPISKASPQLFLSCANGRHFKHATVIARKAGQGQQDYLKIVFQDVLISSYQTKGTPGIHGLPVESIAFNFARFTIHYRPQMADGSLGANVFAGWDQQLAVEIRDDPALGAAGGAGAAKSAQSSTPPVAQAAGGGRTGGQRMP